MKSIFTVLRALPDHPLLLPDPWQLLIFLLSAELCFSQNVIYLESYSMEAFQIGFFHLMTWFTVPPCLFMVPLYHVKLCEIELFAKWRMVRVGLRQVEGRWVLSDPIASVAQRGEATCSRTHSFAVPAVGLEQPLPSRLAPGTNLGLLILGIVALFSL